MMPRPLCSQRGQQRPRDVKHSGQIDVDRAIPIGRIYVGYGPRVRIDTRVVDEEPYLSPNAPSALATASRT